MKVLGRKIVWAIPPGIKPLENAPEGRRRFKFRNNGVGRVFIKTKTGVGHYILEDKGDVWGLIPQGVNQRV